MGQSMSSQEDIDIALLRLNDALSSHNCNAGSGYTLILLPHHSTLPVRASLDGKPVDLAAIVDDITSEKGQRNAADFLVLNAFEERREDARLHQPEGERGAGKEEGLRAWTEEESAKLLGFMQDMADEESAELAPLLALRTDDGKLPGQVLAEALGGLPHGMDPWRDVRDEDRERATRAAVTLLRAFRKALGHVQADVGVRGVGYESAKRRKRWRVFMRSGQTAYPARYNAKRPGPGWRDAIRWALDGRCDSFIVRDDDAPIELFLRPKNHPEDAIERRTMARVVHGAKWLKRKHSPRDLRTKR